MFGSGMKDIDMWSIYRDAVKQTYKKKYERRYEHLKKIVKEKKAIEEEHSKKFVTQIFTPDQFCVKNGILGMGVVIFFPLLNALKMNDKKTRAMIGLSSETFKWKKKKLFNLIRNPSLPPIEIERGEKSVVIKNKSITFLDYGSVTLNKIIEEGIWILSGVVEVELTKKSKDPHLNVGVIRVDILDETDGYSAIGWLELSSDQISQIVTDIGGYNPIPYSSETKKKKIQMVINMNKRTLRYLEEGKILPFKLAHLSTRVNIQIAGTDSKISSLSLKKVPFFHGHFPGQIQINYLEREGFKDSETKNDGSDTSEDDDDDDKLKKYM